MAKMRLVKGLIHDLADSFISPTNLGFINVLDRTYSDVLFNVDFIKDASSVNISDKLEFKQAYYKNWLLSNLERIGVKKEEVKQAGLTVWHSIRNNKAITASIYKCRAFVNINGKEYSAVVESTTYL